MLVTFTYVFQIVNIRRIYEEFKCANIYSTRIICESIQNIRAMEEILFRAFYIFQSSSYRFLYKRIVRFILQIEAINFNLIIIFTLIKLYTFIIYTLTNFK